MQIDHMLTMSTWHVRRETMSWLDACHDHKVSSSLVVYEKDGYGHFILCDAEAYEHDELNDHTLPDDLMDCIEYAQRYDCQWLCLDTDGPVLDGLPKYPRN